MLGSIVADSSARPAPARFCLAQRDSQGQALPSGRRSSRLAARRQSYAASAQSQSQAAEEVAAAATAELIITAAPAVEPKKVHILINLIEWWEKLHASNLVTINTAAQLRRILQRANDLGSTRLVVVEFFAPYCPACRSLYPKLVQIARDEFPDLLFVKMNVSGTEETERLCQELGVETLPTFQLYSGAQGRVAQFGVSLNAASLDRLRTMLRVHSSLRTSIVPGQRGPASVFHADGWPAPVR